MNAQDKEGEIKDQSPRRTKTRDKWETEEKVKERGIIKTCDSTGALRETEIKRIYGKDK